MKATKLLIIISVILVLIAGLYFYKNHQSEDQRQQVIDENQKANESVKKQLENPWND